MLSSIWATTIQMVKVLPLMRKQALSWYRRAAEAGHADAQINMGMFYSDGRRGC